MSCRRILNVGCACPCSYLLGHSPQVEHFRLRCQRGGTYHHLLLAFLRSGQGWSFHLPLSSSDSYYSHQSWYCGYDHYLGYIIFNNYAIGFWKFCSNLSSFTDLREALINQVEFKNLDNLLLWASVSTAVKDLVAAVLQGASACFVWSNINNFVSNNISWVRVLSEPTKRIKINKN